MILRLALLQTKSICFSQVRFLSIVIPRCFSELTDSMVCSCIETAMLLLAEVTHPVLVLNHFLNILK